MKLVFFAALIAVAVLDLHKMLKTRERKGAVAVYVVLTLLAAGVGYMAFYTDVRILDFIGIR